MGATHCRLGSIERHPSRGPVRGEDQPQNAASIQDQAGVRGSDIDNLNVGRKGPKAFRQFSMSSI